MSRLYQVDAECNDQNGLALAFFRTGFYTRLIMPAADAGKASKPVRSKSITELNKALHMACEYSAPGTRAHHAVLNITRYVQATAQASSGTYVRQAQVLYTAVRSLARVDADAEDPARTWLLIGLLAGDTPVGVKGKTVQPTLLRLLAPVITDVRQMTAIKNDVVGGQPIFDVLDLWLVSNAEALWEPSNQLGVRPRFNGRQITNTEYDVLKAIRIHAYSQDTSDGLSAQQLAKHSGHPGAYNALAALRKYPETSKFLTRSGSVRFIRSAPLPPN